MTPVGAACFVWGVEHREPFDSHDPVEERLMGRLAIAGILAAAFVVAGFSWSSGVFQIGPEARFQPKWPDLSEAGSFSTFGKATHVPLREGAFYSVG
jgi:hypothetical protein